MTRLIDADALSEKLCKMTTFIKDGEKFQRMINNAPTIEPDGDTISRRDAMEAVRKVWCNNDDRNDFKQKYYEMGNNDAVEDALGEIEKLPTVVASTEFLISRYDAKDKAKEIIYSILDDTDYNNIESMTHACLMMKIKILKMFDALPSAEAEQVTGKLNKRDDSLLTDDTETCKEQKSKLDLISRQDAINELEHIMCNHPLQGYEDEQLLINALESLPSAESTGAMDEAIQEYIKDGYMQPIGEDIISRQEAIDAFGLSEKTRKYGGDHSGYNTMMLYEIQDVLESLPSAPDRRQRGEWVWDEDAVDWGIGAWVCNKCGSRPQTWWSTDRNKNPLICAGSRFCGNCGADMRGGEDE